MKLNGFEELLHENGIDPGDVFDDRGQCVVTRQGSRAGEYPSFEYFIITTQVRELHHGENIFESRSGSFQYSQTGTDCTDVWQHKN